jgi:hypothetical protein
MNIDRSAATMSPSSEADSDRDVTAAATMLPALQALPTSDNPYRLQGVDSGSRAVSNTSTAPEIYDDDQERYETQRYNPTLAATQQQQPIYPEPVPVPVTMPASEVQQQRAAEQQPQYNTWAPRTPNESFLGQQTQVAAESQQPQQTAEPTLQSSARSSPYERQNTNYGDWLAPAAVGAGAGVLGTEAYRKHEDERDAEGKPAQTGLPTAEHERAFPTAAQPIASELATENREGSQPSYDRPSQAAHTSDQAQPQPSSIGYLGSAPAVVGLKHAAEPTSPVTTPTAAYPTPTTASPATTSRPTTAENAAGDDGETAAHFPDTLEGQEIEGAHETGRFPTVVRHDTNISISQLHVPGEF